MDSQIRPLELTETQKDQLVDFMLGLTDERVRFERAPFDHPALCVPSGQPGGPTSVTNDPLQPGQATDDNPPAVCLQAVGAGGRAANDPVRAFLSLDQHQP